MGVAVGECVAKDEIRPARPAEIPSGRDDVFVTDTGIVTPVVNYDKVGLLPT
jgi:hypothetical protein